MDIDKKIIRINNDLLDKPQHVKTANEKNVQSNKNKEEPKPVQFIQTKKIKNKRRRIKPIIIAVVSAMAIGLIFGVILLNMMTSFNDSTEVNQSSPVFSNDENIDKTPDTTQYTLESMKAYVVQGGVFSLKENADKHASLLEKNGINPVLWKRDNQYFLFAGVTNNEEQAKKITDSLNTGDSALYVKTWEVGELNVNLSEEEFNWLQLFQQSWVESLQQTTNGQPLPKNDWEKLEKESPSSQTLQPLINQINQMVKQENVFSNTDEAQHQLLILWNQYEQLQNK